MYRFSVNFTPQSRELLWERVSLSLLLFRWNILKRKKRIKFQFRYAHASNIKTNRSLKYDFAEFEPLNWWENHSFFFHRLKLSQWFFAAVVVVAGREDESNHSEWIRYEFYAWKFIDSQDNNQSRFTRSPPKKRK